MKRNPKQDEKRISSFAYRVARRLYAAGDRSLTIEDIKQELWIAWCLAVESFDEDKGVPFEAFLQNGMRLHINRFVEKNVDRRYEEVTAVAIDKPREDDQADLHDVLADGSDLTDEVERRSVLNAAYKRLTPRAALFLKILSEQPQEILQEIRAVTARAEYARTKGVTIAVNSGLAADHIFKIMDASRTERTAIIAEIKKLGERNIRAAQR